MRSAYRKQVERIAPPELIGRQSELRELAAFCTEPGRGPYVWWRAPAWEGKSALLSTFVLHPPEGVRVVSFFITARLAAQDTREAFTQVVIEQLADLLGQDLPPALTTATADAHLLGMLDQAAHALGDRLVLVVDGLDEDRGVTTGPDAHSIAALLPANPPAGMRVVVAGRPNPPIPDDVPAWHPLHDPGIVRLLARSEYAQDVRKLAQQELRRLLHGTPAQQALLGLLAAARGGLSGPDLVELTGEPLWEIEDVLHGVSGRTFTRRVSQWQPDTGPDVYLLGHEELLSAACSYLGTSGVTGYRDRLHTWATTYQADGWPTGTPEYLLRGYFRMLQASGDTRRLIACAADTARHDRMLDLTGGDTAGFAEIATTMDAIVRRPDADVAAMARLAVHRDDLANRNFDMPAELPAVWVSLGEHSRAETLAHCLDPYNRPRALAMVAQALAAAGVHDRAVQVAGEAKTATRSMMDETAPTPFTLAGELTEVAEALAVTGQYELAETVVRSIPEPDKRPGVLARVAQTLAITGLHDGAVQLAVKAATGARSIADDPAEQADVLSKVAEALAAAGQHERATQVAGEAESAARLITAPYTRGSRLSGVAKTLAAAGMHEQAGRVAGEAESTAYSITDDWPSGGGLLAEVAGALAAAGLHERAVQAANLALSAARRAENDRELADVVSSLAAVGLHEQAAAAIRSITGLGDRALALSEIAEALAAAGLQARAQQAAAEAETAARSRGEPYVLALAARALAAAGLHDRARQVLGEAETAARLRGDLQGRDEVLAAVAEALAATGLPELAETAVRAIKQVDEQARALHAVAPALAAAGLQERVARLAAEQVASARTTTHGHYWWWVAEKAIEALALAGLSDRAAQMAAGVEADARSFTNSKEQGSALQAVATALAAAGLHQQAERAVRSIRDPDERAAALGKVARVLASAGLQDRARELATAAETAARSISPWSRAHTLSEVATALAAAGLQQRAAQVATDAETAARAHPGPRGQGQGHSELVEVASALAASGLHMRAEAVARSITDSWPRGYAMAEIAKRLAEAGLYERAENMARSTSNLLWRADALAAVTSALVTAGLDERARQIAGEAESTARSISEPYLRARGLASAAYAWNAAGQADRARWMIALALAAAPLTSVLGALAELAPEALITVRWLLLGDD